MNGDIDVGVVADSTRRVFVTGGTGYLGSALIARLLAQGHVVSGLVRARSAPKLPSGTQVVIGDALDAQTFAARVTSCDTFVQLVGVPHPAPWKARQFRDIDLASARAGLEAAVAAKVAHFVYVSVAQPAPTMKAYVRVRAECEALIRGARVAATILRPWYVIGPGHRWPIALQPVYSILERVPATRESAIRLGLVRHQVMVAALAWAIENPPRGIRILDTAAIRKHGARA